MSSNNAEKIKVVADFIAEDNVAFSELPENKIRRVEFFKEYSKNPNRAYTAVAQKLAVPKKTAENWVESYVFLVKSLQPQNRIDPNSGKNLAVELVLRWFNEDLVRAGVDNDRLMSIGQIQSLMPVYHAYKHKYHDANEMAQDVSFMNKNPTNYNTNTNMSFNGNLDYSAPQNPQGPAIYDPSYVDRDEFFLHNGDIEITKKLESLLINNAVAFQPNTVQYMLKEFATNQDVYLSDESAFKHLLVPQLRSMSHKAAIDSITYIFFQSLRRQGKLRDSPLGGGYGPDPYGMGGGMGMGGMGGQPSASMNPNDYMRMQIERMRMNQEAQEEDSFDKNLNKMMKMQLMKSLSGDTNSGGNNDILKSLIATGGVRASMRTGPDGQPIVDFQPGYGGNQQGPESNLTTMLLSKLVEKMFEKPENGDLTQTIMAKAMESAFSNNNLTNKIQELEALKKFMNPGSSPPSEAQLSYELKKSELDIRKEVMLNDINYKHDKDKFEREVHADEQQRANEMTDKILGGLTTMLDKGAPVILEMLKSGGLLPGGQQQEGQGQPQQGYPEEYPIGGVMPVEDQGLETRAYFDTMSRANREDMNNQARYVNESLQETKSEINQIKNLITHGPQQNQGQVVQDYQNQNELQMPVTDQIVGEVPVDMNIPNQQGQGLEQMPSEQDFDNATPQELMDAKRDFDKQKSEMDEYQERLLSALNRKLASEGQQEFKVSEKSGSSPDGLEIPTDQDPDYTGDVVNEVRQEERESNVRTMKDLPKTSDKLLDYTSTTNEIIIDANAGETEGTEYETTNQEEENVVEETVNTDNNTESDPQEEIIEIRDYIPPKVEISDLPNLELKETKVSTPQKQKQKSEEQPKKEAIIEEKVQQPVIQKVEKKSSKSSRKTLKKLTK
jgi:hypothetical protein